MQKLLGVLFSFMSKVVLTLSLEDRSSIAITVMHIPLDGLLVIFLNHHAIKKVVVSDPQAESLEDLWLP